MYLFSLWLLFDDLLFINSFKQFHDECHGVIFFIFIILRVTELLGSVSLFVFKSNFFKYFAAPLSLSFGVFEFMYIWPFEVVRELNDDLTFYPYFFLSVCFIWMFSIANSPNSLIFFFCKVYLRNFQLRNCSFISRKSFWIFQRVFNMSLLNVFNISSKILSI